MPLHISQELENLPVESSASSGGGGGGPSILDADKNALQVPAIAFTEYMYNTKASGTVIITFLFILRESTRWRGK